MTLRLGSIAPDFEAETTAGPIKFSEWSKGSWTILFSHPDDFTPVCTTELGEVAKLMPEFEKRSVKVIGLSANDVSSHERWVKDIEELSQAPVAFPVIGDADRTVATLYDMLDALDKTNVDAKGMPFTVRSVFVIDPQRVIRLMLTYPASTGRHFGEILRVIDSLQLGDKYRVTTPVNWTPGQPAIVHPSVQGEDVEKLFPGHKVVKPYLRFTSEEQAKTFVGQNFTGQQ